MTRCASTRTEPHALRRPPSVDAGRRRALGVLAAFAAASVLPAHAQFDYGCLTPPEAGPARAVDEALARAAALRPEALPQLALAPREISVSGLSSGAAMAMQLHLAHSAVIGGAGILAGVPASCALAEGLWENYLWANASRALARCMDAQPGEIPVAELAARLRRWAQAGRIDPLGGLAAARVWLLAGRSDATVLAPAMEAVAQLYRMLAPQAEVAFERDVPVGHGWPTEAPDPDPADAIDTCARTAAPFLNPCRYPATRRMLAFLTGRAAQPAATGRLLRFAQAAQARAAGMGEHGWLVLPPRIDADTRLHIAFHGCRQGAQCLGDLFVRETGFLDLAGAYNLVVLLPQATHGWLNPRGCWDWWGYTEAWRFGGADRYDFATRCGAQIQAVMRMAGLLCGNARLAAYC